MRRLVPLVLVVTVLVSCGGDPPGTLESATAETRAFLEETVETLFPTHTYSVEVGRATSAWCEKRGGVMDQLRESVLQELLVDLDDSDDPLAMAAEVVAYWESQGLEVHGTDFGDGRVAGDSHTDEGHLLGYVARSWDFPHLLKLEAFTACYRKE